MDYTERAMVSLGEPPELSAQPPNDDELLNNLSREELIALVKQKNQEITTLQETNDYDPKFPSLLNYRAFKERFEKYLKSCQREQERTGSYRAGSIAFIDLDNFKKANDSLGHSKGDEVLQLVAQLIRAEIRPDDEVSRFGGDEIVILFRRSNQDGAVIGINRVQKNLKLDVQTLLPEGADFIQTLSCGVAEIPSNITPEQFANNEFCTQLVEDTITAADHAHYKGAKEVEKDKIGVMFPGGKIQTAIVTYREEGRPPIVTYHDSLPIVASLSLN